jgi:dihydroxyacid dehydratase/phosphogluconate dehydratase
VTTCLALSGSTNAIVHMIALARRAGIDLTLNALRRYLAADAGARERPPDRART